jgi:antitoxin component HigA of HigAB toxin-antitoxin module
MNGYKPQRPARWGERKPTPAAKPLQQTPLGEDRFQSLLTQVNAFFAEAEQDKVAERTAAITEIQALMAQYGLSTQDLLD